MKYILKNRKRTGIVIGLILVTVLCIGCSGKENTKKTTLQEYSLLKYGRFFAVFGCAREP